MDKSDLELLNEFKKKLEQLEKDSTILNHDKDYVLKADITDKRDVNGVIIESSRFLKKMEEKAKENILAALKLNDNKFNCNIFVALSPMDLCYRIKVIFALNNTTIVVNHITDDTTIVMSELVADVAAEISKVFLDQGLTKLFAENPALSKSIVWSKE